jgi:hypothetical protein
VSTRVLVLPSPLLGPASYRPLALELERLTGPVVVADLPVDPRTPQSVLATFESAVDERADVLVAHSNAGYYLPALVGGRGGQGRQLAVVAMDAALPTGHASDTPLAPPGFAEFLASLPLADGRLPAWPAWWDRADIEPLFPDHAWLERVSREAPRLPPSYFTGRLQVPAGWEAGVRGYLAFNDTYADEVAFARAAGWVVREEAGHHLQHLAEPATVARSLHELIVELLG